MNRDEDYQVRTIPDNFGNGINIAGMHFRAIFLIEGLVLAALMFLLSLLVMKFLGFKDFASMSGISLVFVGISLVIGVRGINDEPLTTFLRNVMFFHKHRRTAYFNPRIKLEAKSVMMEKKDNKDAIPREKIIAFFSRYKEAIDKKQQERTRAFEEANAFDKTHMYFEDDIGVIRRPAQYMTREEAEAYDKKKQKTASYRKEKLRSK